MAKKTKATVIVTNKMVEAGAAIVGGFNSELDDAKDVARAVFLAMLDARPERFCIPDKSSKAD